MQDFVVRVNGIGVDSENHPFIVMPKMKCSLSDLIRSDKWEKIPFSEKIAKSQFIAAGFGALHEKNILHRDLKSSNILVSENGKWHIADLGLAKIESSTKAEMTPLKGFIFWP